MKGINLQKRILLIFFCMFFFVATAKAQVVPNAMYQVSTINALIQGVYEGEISVGELKKYGDFGIGTYDGLDGEMVVLDGQDYHVTSTGNVVAADDKVKTPFANVLYFKPELFGEINDAKSFSDIEKALNSIIKDTNYIYAIRIDGVMNLQTRAIPKKGKPYPTLAEAAKTQSVFNLENAHGTIVGIWCPQYMNGINVPGYHLHFISDDRKSGGHILSGGIVHGKVQVARIADFQMVLPNGDAFKNAALNSDYSKELRAVEQSN